MEKIVIISKKKKKRDVIILKPDEYKSEKIDVKNKFSKHKETTSKIDSVVRRFLSVHGRKYAQLLLAAAIATVAVVSVALVIISRYPYEININGETICYVKGQGIAERAIDKIIETYTPKDTVVKAVDTDGTLVINRADEIQIEESELMNLNQVVAYILNDYQKHEKALKVTIASAQTKEAPYTPIPKYIKDDNLVAGEEEIEKEGKAGSQEVTTTYVSVNGKVKSKTITNRKVINEGKKAVVRRGTIGLPDGEDWRTFNGDPIFKNGEELSKAGLSHLGAPYKYGGTSFKTGIDCVALVRSLYKQYGITLPKSHKGIQHYGKGVSLKNAQKGDIVCYRGHMGIYIGDGKMVNAVHKGVSVSNVKPGKVVTVRRVVK